MCKHFQECKNREPEEIWERIISSVPLVPRVFRPFTLYTLPKGGQRQGDQSYACVPYPISHRSCLVVDSQHPMGLCMAGASSSLNQAFLTAYLLTLSLRGPAGVFPLHPKPLTAAFCRLRYSSDCRTLALALIPWSLSSRVTDVATKPLQPTSTGRTSVFQP